MIIVLLLLVAGVIIIVFGLIISGEERKVSSPSLEGQEKVDHYQDKAIPDQGVFNNIGTRIQVESDTKTQEAVNRASAAVVDGIRKQTEAIDATLNQEELPDAHRRKSQEAEAASQAFIAERQAAKEESELKSFMIQKAHSLGISLGILEKFLEKELLDSLDIKKLQEQARVTLESGFIYQLREYHKIMMLRRELDGLFFEIDQIESSKDSESLKKRKIAEREADIKALRRDRRGRRQRLLQALNGEDNNGSDSDTDYREYLDDPDA